MLIHTIIKYLIKSLIISGEKYIDSFIQKHYSWHIQEIFYMPLYIFFQLEIWLKKYIRLQALRHITVTK